MTRCPTCQKIEARQIICRHCGHEYREQTPAVMLPSSLVPAIWLIGFVMGLIVHYFL